VYADAGCTALLIDASAEMRDAAAVNAAGLPNVRCLQSRLETLTADVVLADLIVVPNGALNQLAHDLPLLDVFRPLAGVLTPGCRILVQALLGEPVEACGFYEPLRGGSTGQDDISDNSADEHYRHKVAYFLNTGKINRGISGF